MTLTLQDYLDKKFEALQALPVDWDGSGGKPVSKAAASAMRRALDTVMSSESVFPYLVPSGDGGMLAEWHAGPRKLEIEVDASGELVSFAARSGEEPLCSCTVNQFTIMLRSVTTLVKQANPNWQELFQP